MTTTSNNSLELQPSSPNLLISANQDNSTAEPLPNSTNSYTLLRDLRPHMSNCVVAVRVLRTWEVSAKAGHTWEFIVVDTTGNPQHGKILMSAYPCFASLLTEGQQVSIANFQVLEDLFTSFAPLPKKSYMYLTNHSQVTALSDTMNFPHYVFNLVSFEDLHQHMTHQSSLIDVIGVFARLSDLPGRKEIIIYNAQKKIVKISFWQQRNALLAPDTLEPNRKNTVVVCAAQVKSHDGYINLNATKASKVYVNIDIPEASRLEASFHPNIAPGPLSRIMNTRVEVRNLSYIRFMLGNHNQAPYTCRAEIIQVYTSRGWHYISCNVCKRKLKSQYTSLSEIEPTAMNNYCEKCKRRVIESEIRLMIHFRIKDKTDEVDLSAFEDVVTEITRKTTDDFLQLENHGGSDNVSAAMNELIGSEYYFHVKPANFENVNHQKALTAVAACLINDNSAKRRRIGDQ